MIQKKRLKALGIAYDPITFDEILSEIERSVSCGTRLLIGYANLHGAYLSQENHALSSFSKMADIFYADGMPLVLWRKILWNDTGREHRSTLSQCLPMFLHFIASRNFRIYYIGSEDRVLKEGLRSLKKAHPTLQIEGHHGFFDKGTNSLENKQLLEQICEFKPHILMVGMGMPIQEKWILENLHALTSPVIYATGAAVEYFSGHVARPPAWMSKNGLEWAFRLYSQPKKLWHRYLVEPWHLVGAAWGDIKERLYERS